MLLIIRQDDDVAIKICKREEKEELSKSFRDFVVLFLDNFQPD